MTGFKMADGDLVITNNEIECVAGNELTTQTIQGVLSTNQGEWLFDPEEGINFRNIFGDIKMEKQNSADSHIRQENSSLKRNQNELSERLKKRLDGDL